VTLESFDDGAKLRLTECPFCGRSLDREKPPEHLRSCDDGARVLDALVSE